MSLPRQVMALTRGDLKNEVLSSHTIWLCASCYACTTECPRKIRITDIMHFLGVPETLALGRELGLAMPKSVRILCIEVADPFTISTHLTPPVKAELPRVIGRAMYLAAA